MKIRIKAKMRAPRINTSRYEKVLEKLGRAVLSEAVFEYVVTAQAFIPVWTGASVLTLSELANLIGAPLIVTPTGSAAQRPNLVNKSQAKAKATSGGSLNLSKSYFSFSFHTALPHLVYNEYRNANLEKPPELFSQLKQPGPYMFQKYSKTQVLKVLKKFHLPDPRDHITIKKVSVR